MTELVPLSLMTVWPEQIVPVSQVTPSPGVGPDELIEFYPGLTRLGWFFVGFLITILIGRVVIQPFLARLLHQRNRRNPTIRDAVLRYFQVLIVIIAMFVGAGVAGYGQFLSNSALVISAVMVAIGIAAQEVIGSIVSGMALVADPEFNVGDHIEWSDGEGIVQSITLRVTRVITQNGEFVTIPNTMLTNDTITRPYVEGAYRLVEYIGIGYDDDIKLAETQLKDVVETMDRIAVDPPPKVFVDSFGDDEVIMRLDYWINEPNRQDVLETRSAVAQEIIQRLENQGISISPPAQRELHGHLDINKHSD